MVAWWTALGRKPLCTWPPVKRRVSVQAVFRLTLALHPKSSLLIHLNEASESVQRGAKKKDSSKTSHLAQKKKVEPSSTFAAKHCPWQGAALVPLSMQVLIPGRFLPYWNTEFLFVMHQFICQTSELANLVLLTAACKKDWIHLCLFKDGKLRH